MPNTGNVKDFIEYYKSLHKNKTIDDRVRYVQFEDLIFDFGNTSDDIFKWLGLKYTHNNRYFDPSKSINNTKL